MNQETTGNNLETFIGRPEDISVRAFQGSITALLSDPKINISPDLKARFAAIQGGNPAGPTRLISKDLRYQRSFSMPEREIPQDKRALKLPEGLWYVAALVMEQRHGGDVHLNLNLHNAVLFDDGTVVSIDFKEGEGWSIQSRLAHHVFAEGTRIILPT